MHPPHKWINSAHLLLLLDLLSPKSNRDTCPSVAGKEKEKPQSPSRRAVVFYASLMILALAVVIGTKRLAFGITISAFLLLVLEYVGSSSFKLQFIRITNWIMQLYNPLSLIETSDDDDVEIEIVNQTETGTYRHDSGRVDSCYEVRQRNVMDEKKMNDAEVIEVSGTKERRSRRAVLKSKIIRRLVPKKFRPLKYCKGSEGKLGDNSMYVKVKEGDRSNVGNLTIREIMSEVESESEECKYLCFPLEPAKVDDKKQCGSLSLPSNHSLNREADSVIFGSAQSYEFVKSCDISNKLVASNIKIDARGKSGCVMLVVIVLTGLVGGRILSFLLAIGYCCIVKYLSTLRRECAKQIFTSSVQI